MSRRRIANRTGCLHEERTLLPAAAPLPKILKDGLGDSSERARLTGSMESVNLQESNTESNVPYCSPQEPQIIPDVLDNSEDAAKTSYHNIGPVSQVHLAGIAERRFSKGLQMLVLQKTRVLKMIEALDACLKPTKEMPSVGAVAPRTIEVEPDPTLNTVHQVVIDTVEHVKLFSQLTLESQSNPVTDSDTASNSDFDSKSDTSEQSHEVGVDGGSEVASDHVSENSCDDAESSSEYRPDNDTDSHSILGSEDERSQHSESAFGDTSIRSYAEKSSSSDTESHLETESEASSEEEPRTFIEFTWSQVYEK